jgi:predicted TIM-barrel fold metal-dependent hydrolase
VKGIVVDANSKRDVWGRGDDGLIDVHAHYTTPDYVARAVASGHRRPDGMPEQAWPDWTLDAQLDFMDSMGITQSYLSISSPGVHFGDDASARTTAREVNDAAASLVEAHPDRFGFFASLPLPDIDGGCAELCRAVDDLGARGAIMLSNAGGVYLGHPSLTPVLEELDRRSSVLFVHPTRAPCLDEVACGRPAPMIEFLFDTARSVLDYILSGAAQRFPNINVIVPDCGGVLPLLIDRVNLYQTLGHTGEHEAVSAALRRFYVELAGRPSSATQIVAMNEVFSSTHVLYGSDFPWTPAGMVDPLVRSLDSVLGSSWRRRSRDNADRLMGTGA